MARDMALEAELRAMLEDVPALDQHAHLLSGADVEWSLPRLLTESADPTQVDHVRHHPGYHRALADLAGALDTTPDETAVAAARHRRGFDAHARRLFAAGRFEAVLVDDGFPVPGALDLPIHAGIAGCSVYRVVRIETEAEAAAGGWPGFPALRERFRHRIAAALDGGAVALKTIAAYRCGLDLPRPDAGRAEAAYGQWASSGPARLVHPDLVAWFVADALDVARTRPVPLQVHTGVGDADLALHRADPALLGPLVADAGAAGAPVVLLHCYPFIRQAAWLAHVYGHVYVDLSLALLLAGHRGTELVLEMLELAPASKVLFATDASRAPEMFFLAARWWRDALAGALARLAGAGLVDDVTARQWGSGILAGNARRIYGLG